jgi:alpha-L-rhamnosidase
VPNGAPWQPGCGGGVAWGAAICIMPWEFYLHYGAKDVLEYNYEGMKGYIRYMQTWVNDEGIMFSKRNGNDGKPLQWFNLGDWCVPKDTVPDDLVHTFYFWRCADLTSKTAKILNKSEEAMKYAILAEQTKKAFHKRFYNVNTGSYGKGGGNIFALKMGVPTEQYEKVISSLKADILANDGHLDTGIFGTQFFFEILAENGMQDLAYGAMNKRTEPGFGYWLEQGATTTRESWISEEGGSFNHPMFGGGITWFYRKLAGMNTDPEEPGYRHIIFRPQPVDDLKFVRYSNNNPFGEAGIEWNKKDGKLVMDVTIPVGAYASVYVPVKEVQDVKESNKPLEKSKGIKFEKMEDGYALFTVESGKYFFTAN